MCEQPNAREEFLGDSQRERGTEQMAQRGRRMRNLSDSSATYDSERAKSQDGTTGPSFQDSPDVKGGSSEGRCGLQRRESLAAFHQHRQRDAAAGSAGATREATFTAGDQISRTRWRKKEHIYESLDDIIDDLKQSSPALDAALKQQARSRKSKAEKRQAVQEKERNTVMLRPHFHSVDQLPSQYFPAPSHTPSPSMPAAAKTSGAALRDSSQTADAFSSLQSADSGYLSTERGVPTHPSSGKVSSAHIQHFPSGLLPPHTVLQSDSGAHAVSGGRDGSTRARQELHPQSHPHHQHPFTHRRQGSSPASLQRDTAHQTAVAGLGPGLPVQPVRSDRILHRNYSPKSILKKVESAKSSGSSSKKGGHSSGAKQQKSKSGGPISFLATLNKVSGTESVSDFDFHPTNSPPVVPQLCPLVTQSATDMDRPTSPFLSHSQPSPHDGMCESYIGLIGPAYHQQLVRPVGSSAHRSQGQHSKPLVTDARRKESFTAQKGRDASSTKKEGGEEEHMQKFSLSQPASNDSYDDDTLVLYKGNSPSYQDDDTLVMHNRKLAKKREAALKESQAHLKMSNAVEDAQAAPRRDKGSRDSHGVSRRDSGSNSHGVSRRDSGSNSHGVSRRDSGLNSHGVSRRDSGSNSHGVSRRDSGLNSHGVSRRDSGSKDLHGVSRRDSGSNSHGVSRSDSGLNSHGVSMRDSGSKDLRGVSRRNSGSKDSPAVQRFQYHSQIRHEHHYGPATRNHMVSGSDGRKQPKTFANRPTHPIMEETWC